MLSNIGHKIKEAREDQGLSQKDLGIALGLSDKAISAYEASRTIPPLETLVRIADELNKPLEYFITQDSSDFKIESRLASMESIVEQLLAEIKRIKEYLEANPKVNREENLPESNDSDSLSTPY